MSAKPSFSPRLVIIEGTEKGKVIDLENGTAVIGRSKGDVLIHDPRISRSHVAIHFDNRTGKVTFTDLKSLNGTLVNGEPLETGLLHDGDKLHLGNTILDCQIASDGDEAETKSTGRRSPKKGKPRVREPKRDEATQSELPLLDDDGLHEPREWDEREESANEATQIFFLRRVYLKVPRRVRVYALCLAALAFVMIHEYSGKGTPSGPGDRNVASVRKLESEGKVDEAIALAEQIRALDVKNIEVYIVLGDLYLERRKVDKAITAYKEALKLDANRGVVFVKLARLYLNQGRREDADAANREIDRLIVEGPQVRDFFVEVANLYLDYRELQIPPQKMVIIGQALQNKIAPGEIIGMKLEALGLILQNFCEQAIVILDHAHKLFPQDQSIFQYLVVARLKLKDLAGAGTTVQEWSKAFPDELRPLYVMAQINFENRQFAEATAVLEKLVQQSSKSPNDPVLPEALHLLGRLYRKSPNQQQEATTVLKHACDLGYSPSCELLRNGDPPSEEPPFGTPG
jgi:cytochrome c-type biogenesis protein CcmH/NrfG